jgi:hypothetical protein
VSDLQSYTEYVWYIQVDDGKDTVEQTLWFKTEPIEPIVSNPVPADGEREVPIDLPSLHFTVKDFQGDLMDYTVETSPNIGSGSGTNVHDGTYTVPISGLAYGTAYHWYVNVTDGAHWARKMFYFEATYPAQFNPFEYGWHYRKQITINHTNVADDLTNFPVLISTVDVDLSQNTQADGGDILFMNNQGVAIKLYHEIDTYKASSGELIAWVNIPSLSIDHDTIFYMYYGNPDSFNLEYPEKTWDAHYVAVYHMNDGTDSSQNRNHLTTQGGISTTAGRIGSCYSFDGIDDYLTDIWTPPSKITIETWFYSDVKDTIRDIVCIRKNPSHGHAVFEIRDASENYRLAFTGGEPDNELVFSPDWNTQMC